MGWATSERSSGTGSGYTGWLRAALQALRSRPSLTILILLALIGIGLRIRYFGGIQGTDDLSHAYGGYFFFRNFHKGFVVYHGGISSLRIGVDFLLWISFSLFGVHEWSAGLPPFIFSVLGIWAIYFLGRRVAGEVAGLVAAAFLTFLPVDVYYAGVWLQDTILSTLLIASTIWFIRSIEAESRRGAVGWGLLSGAGIGYAAIVKSIAPMLLVAFGIWSLVRLRGDRRVLRVVLVVAGFLLMMGVVAVYWYLLTGDPLFNVRMIAAQYALINKMPTTADSMLLSFPKMIVRQLPFGPVLLLTPVFIVIFAFARSIRYRWLILTIFCLLGLSLMKVAQMGVQQRYLLLIVPSIIIIAAGALTAVTGRLPRLPRHLVLAAVTSLTLVGFMYCPQAMAWKSSQPIRSIHTILSLADTASEPVFADPRTMLALYQLEGFKPYPGGLYRYPTRMPNDWARAVYDGRFIKSFDERYGIAPDGIELPQRRHGWVVFHEGYASKFDTGKWKVPMPQELWDPPSNWTLVASYGQGRQGRLVALYRIQPQAPSFGQLSLSDVTYSPTDYAQGVVDEEITASEEGLRYEATLEPPGTSDSRRFAGVKLPIESDAFRLSMSFEHPDEIAAVYVYASDGDGVPLAWRAAGQDLPRADEQPTYMFLPGELSDPFVVTRMITGREVSSVDVFVEAASGADSAGFAISKVEIRRY